MDTNTTLITKDRAISIVNSRVSLTQAHIGKQVILLVQGAGTFQTAAQQAELDKAAGKAPAKQYFDKYIHNLKANSSEAMTRKENRQLLADAVTAEMAGDAEKASELYNQYLNAIQVSFNLIAQPGRRKLESGDAVTAFIETSETKAGNRAIVVNNVAYKAPEMVEKVKFDITDLIAAPAKAPVSNDTAVTA